MMRAPREAWEEDDVCAATLRGIEGQRHRRHEETRLAVEVVMDERGIDGCLPGDGT